MTQSTFDPAQPRGTKINWPVLIQEILDGYEQHVTLSHAVQKDAIQNGWDARINEKGKGWKFTFELIETSGLTLLTMTDEGTCGLTGRVLQHKDLLTELPEIERWGRFENLAFQKERIPGRSSLGSRGRGKFVFVGTSKNMTILYDSLRNDGTYRFGKRWVTQVESWVRSLDEDDGRKEVSNETSMLLKPLQTTGTRVVIVNPIDELVDDFKNGNFAKAIGETWWENIVKYDAKIILRMKGKPDIVVAPLPKTYPEKNLKNLEVFTVSCVRISKELKQNNLRCKKLHIIYNWKEPVPDRIQGIAIQRDGMKICSHKITNLPPDIRECVAGYITLEIGWDEILLLNEGLEHCSLNWSKHPLNILNQFIKDEVEKFAKEKLGLGVDRRRARARQETEAQRLALKAVNRMAKKLGLLGTGGGNGGGGGKIKPVRVRIKPPIFPDPVDNPLRVNYSETLKGITCMAVNDTKDPVKLKAIVRLNFGDKIISDINTNEFTLDPESEKVLVEKYEIKFTKQEHVNKGRYDLVSILISKMPGESMNKQIDKKKKAIYLEEDAPTSGIFEKCEPANFPERFKKILSEYEDGARTGYVLNYNVKHHEYTKVSDDKQRTTDYLVRLMVDSLCGIDIAQPDPKLFNEDDLESNDAILKKTRQIVSECMYDYDEM